MSWKKVEAILAVVLLLALGMSFLKPSMTGFISAKTERQALGLVIDSSQTYTLRANETLPIISLGISGNVIGNGSVSVRLGIGNESLLIWSNAIRTEETSNRMTGIFPISVEPDTTRTASGAFISECIETCELPGHFQRQGSYDLIFDIQRGTTLQLDEIIYVIAE